MTYVYYALALISAATLLVSCAILHLRARARSTVLLLLAVCFLCFYNFAGTFIIHRLVRIFPSQMDWLILGSHAAVPAGLEFLVAVSFLYFVLSVPRPNNSFKPTPHRGVGHVPTLR